ncbi:hypothetical protein NSPZN2_10698 [Nitrospira defluvii]|uniref:Uncharacterized protein n=1 Tax=Nitrospira defluvii TaxID=330214 RepID=A0ABM8QJR1_9BACT|nr:hypothetical protein NSPZN2_10698 [Nitrospira defluvii]
MQQPLELRAIWVAHVLRLTAES